MGRCQIGPEGGAFDLPPAELLAILPPAGRDYLLALHASIFGLGQDARARGSLDGTNVVLTQPSVRHGELLGLNDDDHPSYLNHARHGQIQGGNPHGVSAADVGADTPQWNADRLQGELVDNAAPGEGHVLTFAFGRWRPAPTQVGPGGGVEFGSVVLEQTLVPGASQVIFPALAPVGSAVFGVFAEVTLAISGCEAFRVGIEAAPDAWGTELGVALGTKTTMAEFETVYPLLVRSPLAVAVGAIGGTFAAGRVELTSRYLTIPGV